MGIAHKSVHRLRPDLLCPNLELAGVWFTEALVIATITLAGL